MKPDSSDPEPEGLTLLVPDIQKTAEIVYAATTSLRQANQGGRSHCSTLEHVHPEPHPLWVEVRSSQTETSPQPSSLDSPALEK